MSAYLNSTTVIAASDIKLGQAWTSGTGTHCAAIKLGASDLTLHQPDEADALMWAAAEAKAALLMLADAAEAPGDGTAAGGEGGER